MSAMRSAPDDTRGIWIDVQRRDGAAVLGSVAGVDVGSRHTGCGFMDDPLVNATIGRRSAEKHDSRIALVPPEDVQEE